MAWTWTASNEPLMTTVIANTDLHWDQALAVLHRVYVGEGYSAAEHAVRSHRRALLETEGDLIVALNERCEVIGATVFLRPDSSLQQVARPNEREFRLLAVHPGERGRGAGAALVQACIDRGREAGAEALVLWTRPVMQSAQRLYERCGFARAPERDEEDPRGFRRLVYRFVLSNGRGNADPT